jgi:hypothetical protein
MKIEKLSEKKKTVAEKQKIKDGKTCSTCGSVVNRNLNYCPVCDNGFGTGDLPKQALQYTTENIIKFSDYE